MLPPPAFHYTQWCGFTIVTRPSYYLKYLSTRECIQTFLLARCIEHLGVFAFTYNWTSDDGYTTTEP